MPFRIPNILQGPPWIHRLFWSFGIYASEQEERIVKSYMDYMDNPTEANWEAYQSQHHWTKQWAEQNTDRQQQNRAMIIPPLDPGPRVRLMQEVRFISELENPYLQDLRAAEEEFELEPNEMNGNALLEIKTKYNHIVTDWKVQKGVLKEDPREQRPEDIPEFAYPETEVKKYEFIPEGNQMRIIKYDR